MSLVLFFQFSSYHLRTFCFFLECFFAAFAFSRFLIFPGGIFIEKLCFFVLFNSLGMLKSLEVTLIPMAALLASRSLSNPAFPATFPATYNKYVVR